MSTTHNGKPKQPRPKMNCMDLAIQIHNILMYYMKSLERSIDNIINGFIISQEITHLEELQNHVKTRLGFYFFDETTIHSKYVNCAESTFVNLPDIRSNIAHYVKNFDTYILIFKKNLQDNLLGIDTIIRKCINSLIDQNVALKKFNTMLENITGNKYIDYEIPVLTEYRRFGYDPPPPPSSQPLWGGRRSKVGQHKTKRRRNKKTKRRHNKSMRLH
jgi:hypothetical protein